MPITIPPEGPLKCTIALIGEAPGATEEIIGRPFVGSAGQLLNKKLHDAGLARQCCYVTNLVKQRPKGNDFSIFWKGKHPTPELIQHKDALLQELCTLDTNVIVALGSNALWALTGHSSIGKWRGSILPITLPNGRQVKVIGTYHPAAALRDYTLSYIIKIDLKRAKVESESSTVYIPKRNLIISPDFNEVTAFVGKTLLAQEVSFDIETTPTNITCISLSTTPEEAISIPTTTYYWGNVSKLKTILELVNIALRSKLIKVGQNMSYDIQYLMRFFHILPSHPWADTLIMQHSCYSELPKSLAFLASIYTHEQYYKDDLKVWQTSNESENEKLWKYNAMDAAVTLECYYALQKEIKELDVNPIYQHMMELYEPLIFMMLKGIRIDRAAIDRHKEDFKTKLDDANKVVQTHFGGVNVNSPKQMKEMVRSLGLKVPTKMGKETMDKKAIEKLAKKSPEFASIVEVRETEKILSNYLNVETDPIDGRFRCSINATGTETGRLSSSESVFWYGTNAQTFPKSIRDMFIPDPGLEFTECDLKGAEAVVVAYESNDPLIIDVLERGENIHNFTVKLIWEMDDGEIKKDKEKCEQEGKATKSKYYMAKRVRHAGHYLIGPRTLASHLDIPELEAKSVLKKFYDRSPNLCKWHAEISAQLRKNSTLITPLGRKRIFLGRWDDSLLREAVAYIPQETVAQVINRGIIKFYHTVCPTTGQSDISILLQIHDALLVQHPAEIRESIYRSLKECMYLEIISKHGRPYHIDLDIKSGPNWKDMVEYKY